MSELTEHDGGPVEEVDEDHPQRFLQRLGDRIGNRSGANAVYGVPVSQGDVTVIPVARARFGFGGGAGRGRGGADQGAGGGGGASSQPIGYIELRDGSARFVPIRDPSNVWPVVLAAGFSAWLILRGLRSLVRRR